MSDQPAPRVKFGPTFAADSTARTLLFFCGLILFGTGSYIAHEAGWTGELPLFHPRMGHWIRMVCIVAYICALFVSFVGTIAVFIHGLSKSGEIVVRGIRYQGEMLSRIALAIFTLPWILLGVLLAFGVLR
jgi:hypothetical protein